MYPDMERPLAYYATLSAAMMACLYLFVTVAGQVAGLRKRFARFEAKTNQDAGATGARVALLETQLGKWADRTGELETTVSGLAAGRRAQAMAAGVDANQRTQVLRLARRGDHPEQIAAELRVPKNEVELLIKVQRAMMTVT